MCTYFDMEVVGNDEKNKMKFACCVPVPTDRLPIMKKLGYNYMEPAFNAMYRATDEEFEELLATKNELGLTSVSANGMFVEEIKLLEGKDSYGKVGEYLDFVFERGKKLGVPVSILGSGGARKIPDGMSKEEATERFCRLLTDVISPYAKKYDIIVGIEELRKEECNFINNCREAMEIVRAVNLPNIKLLVDYYHAMLGGDTLEEIASYADDIVHVHIASPKNNRCVPNEDDYEDCREFFAMLKRINYQGAISLEGRYNNDFESDAKIALDVMTRAYNA